MLKRRSWATGDTIIEVLLAVTIFSLLATLTMGLMNQSVNGAQRSVEITLVRQQIDAQADMLRALHQAVAKSGNPTSKWQQVVDKARTSPGRYTNQACPDRNSTDPERKPPANAFVISSDGLDVIDASGSGGSDYMPAGSGTDGTPYAQVADGTPYGIWIEGKKTERTSGSTVVGAYEFRIRACWDGPGTSTPMTLETVVKLYDVLDGTGATEDPNAKTQCNEANGQEYNEAGNNCTCPYGPSGSVDPITGQCNNLKITTNARIAVSCNGYNTIIQSGNTHDFKDKSEACKEPNIMVEGTNFSDYELCDNNNDCKQKTSNFVSDSGWLYINNSGEIKLDPTRQYTLTLLKSPYNKTLSDNSSPAGSFWVACNRISPGEYTNPPEPYSGPAQFTGLSVNASTNCSRASILSGRTVLYSCQNYDAGFYPDIPSDRSSALYKVTLSYVDINCQNEPQLDSALLDGHVAYMYKVDIYVCNNGSASSCSKVKSGVELPLPTNTTQSRQTELGTFDLKPGQRLGIRWWNNRHIGFRDPDLGVVSVKFEEQR